MPRVKEKATLVDSLPSCFELTRQITGALQELTFELFHLYVNWERPLLGLKCAKISWTLRRSCTERENWKWESWARDSSTFEPGEEQP
mmetsp:Transcript_5618/g.21139  ORF Transcript_5618/g.21139 Transcript_5618/m.21139 type:complete len:88 (-) Transcript_5618:185-448(-)